MYWPDVTELRTFYASPLGQITRRSLKRSVHAIWPELKQDTLVSIGYVQPLLSLWDERNTSDTARPLCVLMPDDMGALYWPSHGDNRVGMCNSAQLPIAAQSTNRILLMHALEHAEPVDALLAECWRALVPGGRLMVIVPNRHGLWARNNRTPFEHGRPYNAGQLKRLLSGRTFTLTHHSTALHGLPLHNRWALKLSPIIEKIMQFAFPALGGVVIMEAEKQIYATVKKPISGLTSPIRPAQAQPAMNKQ